MSVPARNRVAPVLRYAAYAILGVLWLSGTLWWWLASFCQIPADFGPAPHPLQPPLLLVHGLVAIPALYLLGWITPQHVWAGWRSRRRRGSGATLWLLLVILCLTGFALFFLTGDTPRAASALSHEVLGLAAAAAAALHWFKRSPGV